MSRNVFLFGNGSAEGSAGMRDLLGGKGANLAEMCNLGLPVPPGFTITTEVCNAWYQADGQYPEGLNDEVLAGISKLEELSGAGFGDPTSPLLLSVRSGARASMPGMMDTVLNLGLNDETVVGLAKQGDDERFAYDSYRRFIHMYGDVVLGLEHNEFEDILESYKDDRGLHLDTELNAGNWKEIAVAYKSLVESETSVEFPQDPFEQLWGAIDAVFGSWNTARAITYRRLNEIPDDWGTAVNVQVMVFGNMGETSATGVAFTRNPSTGERELFGEFLLNAQGEDVVAGVRTPQHLTSRSRIAAGGKFRSLEELMPEVFSELTETYEKLERHYRDMQDLEFTVQRGKLWMLQTRSGKRTAVAALRIAVEMAREDLIDEKEAIKRIDPLSLDQLLHPTLDPEGQRRVLTTGLPASPGAASGTIVLDAHRAEDRAKRGDSVILVRAETSPEDIHGMHAARGILTARGGMTSHAAVVARGMGRPCVSGAGDLLIDYDERTISVGDTVLSEGDLITIDGGSGDVIEGIVPTVQPELSADFATLMEWADRYRTLGVRANSETVDDTSTAKRFGAEGIGLCRTEHMFFDASRINSVREMILADSEEDRRRALEKILPMQQQDFEDLFEIMAGSPVTIRLLDPPLHEFLPREEEEFRELARELHTTAERIRERATQLFETNPMLGHRGCRLGISFPEIYDMQVKAILQAAIAVNARQEGAAVPEIMVPLVSAVGELAFIRERIEAMAREIEDATGDSVPFTTGTMIELPRAALRAGEIARAADFFSFGTNDLTQTTLGISRDDAGTFLDTYLDRHIFKRDPFVTIDIDGVGELVSMAVERGRKAQPDLKTGICGEHGGDPASIDFCNSIGLDYVSCSPWRVPIARLAAAQAALGKSE